VETVYDEGADTRCGEQATRAAATPCGGKTARQWNGWKATQQTKNKRRSLLNNNQY